MSGSTVVLVIYVLPSIQVYESHAVCTSVPVFEFVIVNQGYRIKHHRIRQCPGSTIVTRSIRIAIYPSVRSHAVCTSVPVFEFVIVKSRVTVLSHPLALVNVQIALLLLYWYKCCHLSMYMNHRLLVHPFLYLNS